MNYTIFDGVVFKIESHTTYGSNVSCNLEYGGYVTCKKHETYKTELEAWEQLKKETEDQLRGVIKMIDKLKMQQHEF